MGTEPIFYNNFKWSIIYKNTESLCCTLETNIVNQPYFNLKYIYMYKTPPPTKTIATKTKQRLWLLVTVVLSKMTELLMKI